MRPRFRRAIDLTADDAVARLARNLESGGGIVEGMVRGNHFELMTPKALRHYWSPRLSLEVTSTDEGTVIYGLFGPRPSVWTLFAAIFMLMALIGLAGGIIGFSQFMIDQTPTGLWLLGVSGAGALIAYSTSLAGQRLATDEMVVLERYVVARLELEESLCCEPRLL